MIYSKGLSIDTLLISKPFPSLMCMVEMLHNARKICSEFLSRLYMDGVSITHGEPQHAVLLLGAMLLVTCCENSADYQMGNCPRSL